MEIKECFPPRFLIVLVIAVLCSSSHLPYDHLQINYRHTDNSIFPRDDRLDEKLFFQTLKVIEYQKSCLPMHLFLN